MTQRVLFQLDTTSCTLGSEYTLALHRRMDGLGTGRTALVMDGPGSRTVALRTDRTGDLVARRCCEAAHPTGSCHTRRSHKSHQRLPTGLRYLRRRHHHSPLLPHLWKELDVLRAHLHLALRLGHSRQPVVSPSDVAALANFDLSPGPRRR